MGGGLGVAGCWELKNKPCARDSLAVSPAWKSVPCCWNSQPVAGAEYLLLTRECTVLLSSSITLMKKCLDT